MTVIQLRCGTSLHGSEPDPNAEHHGTVLDSLDG